MKKLIYFSLIFILGVIGFSFIEDKNTVSYTESSAGLQTIQMENGRTELEFADMNNDGFKDIISVGDHGNPGIGSGEQGIMVWFGNGTGTNWSQYQTGNLGYGGIAAGDVNNDGKQDVGYGIHHNYSSTDLGDQILEVALGDGTGMNWTAWDDSLASQGETWGMFSSDFGDVNNDGLLDIGSISFGCCAGVHIYKNLGTGTWRQTFGFIGGNSSMEFYFADFNNDGNLDFTVSHQNGLVYFGDGLGGFTLMQNNLPAPGSSGMKGVSVGDVNNDGASDLAFIGSGGSVQVWRWNNSSQQWLNLSGNLPASGNNQKTFLYDMNRDGFADVIVYEYALIKIFAGDGGSSWTQIASIPLIASGYYMGMAIGDADNNGYPDIAVVNEEGNWLNRKNYLRFFKENTSFSSLSISPLFPKGGERFKNGQVRFIDWISSEPQGSISKVKLELSQNGSSGPWSTIADSVPNNGRYQWTVPQSIASSNCFIRYTLTNQTGTVTGMNSGPFMIGILLNVENEVSQVGDYKLYQNYPNPFNSMTKIQFQVKSNKFVKLNVFDITGKEIKILVNEYLKRGEYEYLFDAGDLPSGVYFYRLQVGEFSETRSMILIK